MYTPPIGGPIFQEFIQEERISPIDFEIKENILHIRNYTFQDQNSVWNILENFPLMDCITELHLTHVDMQSDCLELLMKSLPSLEVLEVKVCRDVSLLLACFSAADAPKLKRLTIETAGGSCQVNEILLYVLSNPNLCAFSLSGARLAYSLPRSHYNMEGCVNLKEFTLDICRLPFRAADELAAGLSTLPSLEKLSLTKNTFAGGDWSGVFQSKNLKVLNLNSSFDRIGDALRMIAAPLEEIDLGKCNLSCAADVIMLVRRIYFQTGEVPKKITLSDNCFGAGNMFTLLSYFMDIKRSTTVIFSGREACFSQLLWNKDFIARFSHSPLKLEFTAQNPFASNIPVPVEFKKEPMEIDNRGFEGEINSSRGLSTEPNKAAEASSKQLVTAKRSLNVIDKPRKLITIETVVREKDVEMFFEYMDGMSEQGIEGIAILGGLIPEDSVETFIDGLEGAKWLKVLEIKNIENENLLLDALKKPSIKNRLERLVLSPKRDGARHFISEDVLISLLEFLEENSTMRELIFEDVCFLSPEGESGGVVLAQALGTCKNLSCIGFINCRFSPQVADAFVQQFSARPLEKLILRNINGDSDDAPSSFVHWVKLLQNRTLATLDARQNEFIYLNRFLSDIVPVPRNPPLCFVFSGNESLWKDRSLLLTCEKLLEAKTIKFQFTERNPLDGVFPNLYPMGRNRRKEYPYNKYAHPYIVQENRLPRNSYFEQQSNQEMTELLLGKLASSELLTQELFDEIKEFRGSNPTRGEETRKLLFLEAIKKIGYSILKVKADGTCLFHAGALWEKIQNAGGLFAIQDEDRMAGFGLRTQVLTYMQENYSDFQQYIAQPSDTEILMDSGILTEGYTQSELDNLLRMEDLIESLRSNYSDNLQNHLKVMEDPKQHADETEIVALSRLLQARIVVFDSNYIRKVDNGRMVGMPTYGDYDRELYLVREGSHFDLLVP